MTSRTIKRNDVLKHARCAACALLFALPLLAAAGTALVEWRSAFYRGYPNNDPPPDKNADAAVAAVTGIYKAGLGNLKAVVEKR
jgi:hypothetical protein